MWGCLSESAGSVFMQGSVPRLCQEKFQIYISKFICFPIHLLLNAVSFSQKPKMCCSTDSRWRYSSFTVWKWFSAS